MTLTLDQARVYIARVRWRFAKTMPQWPHEYTVREWQPELEPDFLAFALLIRADGTVKPWPLDSATPRYHNSYLELDGWDYWTMGAPIPETAVINRAGLPQDQRRAPAESETPATQPAVRESRATKAQSPA